MSDISKAISGRNTQSSQKDSLEKQVEAAEYFGEIKSDLPNQQQPKKRGRPPTKSKSPGRTASGDAPPSKTKDPTPKNVDDAIEEIKKTTLVAKLRAYAAYWPEVCGPTLSSLNVHLCNSEQLQKLCDTFEQSVHSYSEIVDIPQSLKQTLIGLEPLVVGIGMTNPQHPFLKQGVMLQGLTKEIMTDSKIDHNIKLIAIRFMGKMPKNPFLNLAFGIVHACMRCYKGNIMKQVGTPVDDKYAEL